MIAWKFLRSGAVGPFSGLRWPAPSGALPGPWVEAHAPPAQCRSGIHACRVEDLSFWIGPELWVVELAGEVIEGVDGVIAVRARLLAEIEAWRKGGGAEFAAACARRASELAGGASGDRSALLRAYAADLAHFAGRCDWNCAAYIGCVAAAKAVDPGRANASFLAERLWQGEWIADRFRLRAPATVA
jgi:hypothetical protein